MNPSHIYIYMPIKDFTIWISLTLASLCHSRWFPAKVRRLSQFWSTRQHGRMSRCTHQTSPVGRWQSTRKHYIRRVGVSAELFISPPLLSRHFIFAFLQVWLKTWQTWILVPPCLYTRGREREREAVLLHVGTLSKWLLVFCTEDSPQDSGLCLLIYFLKMFKKENNKRHMCLLRVWKVFEMICSLI